MAPRLIKCATLLASFAASPALAEDEVVATKPKLHPMAMPEEPGKPPPAPGVAPGRHGLTCMDYGCYHPYEKSNSCQCNVVCVKYQDCCPDYFALCTENDYSKQGRKNQDPMAPKPDHHKNTPGTSFTTGFIRNIKVGGVRDGRIIVGYQGMGKLYMREHKKGHDQMIKEIKGYYKPGGVEVPGPSRVDQIKKFGDRNCWYAEFPAPKKMPFEISVDGSTSEHTGPAFGKVVKPDVEAHVYARIDEKGEVEFARNRNFEPATLWIDKHPIPIGESYTDQPHNDKPRVPRIEL